MSSGMIRLNEEIDQVIKLLDTVVGSYSRESATPEGLRTGVAHAFYFSLKNGQDVVNESFKELDTKLGRVTEAMRASIADHRNTEAEASDILSGQLNEIAAIENGAASGDPQQLNLINTGSPQLGTTGKPDGSR